MQRRTYLAAIGTAVAASLAGCGNDDGRPGRTETPTPDRSGTATGTPTAATETAASVDVTVTFPSCDTVRVEGDSFASVAVTAAGSTVTYEDGFRGARTFSPGGVIAEVTVSADGGERTVANPSLSDCRANRTPGQSPTETPSAEPTETEPPPDASTPPPTETPTEPDSPVYVQGDYMGNTQNEVFVAGTVHNDRVEAVTATVTVDLRDGSGQQVETLSESFDLESESERQFRLSYSGAGWESVSDYEISVTE